VTDLHLTLDRSAGRLAAQIAAGFRAAVRSGRLTAGTRLPSSRDLARDLDVSRGVVVTAYEQLTAEGFLIARRGDGTRIAPLARSDEETLPASRPPAAPRPAEPRPEPAVLYDLEPGRPDLSAFPRERWIAAARAALRTLPHDALTYPDPGGVPALRAELASYLGRVRAAHADAGRVVIMNGVAHGLSALIRLLRADGHTVLAVEDPTSARQLPMLAAAGIRVARIPVDGEGLDVEALARTQARAVLVTPAHQYPTGVVLSAARRAELIAWARRVDGVILEDDYDAEFRYDRDPVGCLQGVDPDRVVLLGSVSKSLAPALRLGWAVAPPSLAARLRDHRTNTDLGAPVLEQHALTEFITGGAYDRHLRTMRRRYRARRDALGGALAAHLPGAMVHGVSAGIHLYVELPDGCDEDEVVARAARAGVSVTGARPMWSPGRGGGGGGGGGGR
jgi:DNA-binding transcriptional MocR family regulator